jgi:ATP-dependent DNA helicase RecG
MAFIGFGEMGHLWDKWDMCEAKRNFGVAGWFTGGSHGEVQRLLGVMVGEMKRTDIQETLALRHEDYFRATYRIPALTASVIEMTIPDKPTSSKQKYRLTQKGCDLIAKLAKEGK